MGILNIFRGQFIDVIEWPEENPRILVHRFDRHNNEIKWGAKLIVRPGQKAVFVSQGNIADHFGPGTYPLESKNIPILTTLLSLPYNFNSPFKAEVYFIRTTEQLDRKWGTATPVMMRDADFGTVRLRARGNFSYKVGGSNDMLARFVGARSEFTCDDIESQMKSKVVSAFSDALGELKIPALDLAAQYNEIGDGVRTKMSGYFADLGFELTSFIVENISLPDEVNAAMDKRASVGALGGMGNYTQLQAADAMKAAAENPGGAGNMMGVLMGAQLGANVGQAVQQGFNAPPPPPPAAVTFYVAVNGQQAGPYDLNTLKTQALGGTFTRTTMVWKQGMAAWQEAATVPELASVFAAVPPPLP
jgi:membrane protease subunit (stomatin/prohibitin family)